MKPLFFIVALSLAAGGFADIVHLKDGNTLEGTIRRTRDGYVVTDAAGKTTNLPADVVTSIELKKTLGVQGAEGALASLRRSAANMDDLRQIISRYETFISQNGATPAAGEARQDLVQWQDRLNRKLVKAGHEWVTQEQFAAIQAKARQSAAKIVPMIKAGQLKEAAAAIDASLAEVPDNADLLYLKGVVLYRQSQLVPSRNAFQAATAQQADLAAAHNNTAVIQWKTRSQMPALAEFDKAMLASPQNQTVLDNVAEALHALPESFHKNELTRRVIEHFNSQDRVLQRQMKERGLYRWGSQWFDEKQSAELQQQKKAVQDRLDELQKQFDANQQRLLAIAREYESDQQMLNIIQQQSVMQDGKGNAVQLPLPQRYYDLQSGLQQLRLESDTRKREQLELQRLAVEEKKKLPEEQYTGTMKVFDVEGLSLSTSTPPETKPVALETRPMPPMSRPASRPASSKGGSDY